MDYEFALANILSKDSIAFISIIIYLLIIILLKLTIRLSFASSFVN